MENDSSNQEEFYDNIKALDARDLSILHGMLMLDDEREQKLYLRKMRTTKLDGTLYNAFCSRVLVEDPILHVKNEIILRFTQLFCRNDN